MDDFVDYIYQAFKLYKTHNMKSEKLKSAIITVLLFTLLSPAVTKGQIKYNSTAVTTILNNISEKLNSIQTVSYKYKRETVYSGDNYRNSFTSNIYIDFTTKNNNAGYRFQTDDDKFFACYNGTQYFGLQKTKKTIDITQKPGSDLFESLSPLYNSIITLRNIIPLLISDTKIKKTITDTTIDKTDFYLLQVELYNHYFSNLGTIAEFTSEYIGDKHKPYEILINKVTLLPYRFITKFNDKPDDYVTAFFADINTNPKAPEELSWFYSTYSNEYSLPAPKKAMITTGAIPENWVLPSYNPLSDDSVSLYQYRGKIVMLDFWIKSCGPCIASFPHLNELQQKFGKDGFQLLSINTEDTKEDIAFFYKKHKPVYKILFKAERFVDEYGIYSFPGIILLNKSGKIIYSGGGFDQAVIEKIINDNL